MHIDLAFRLQGGDTIPSDHGYLLYAAVSRIVPELHQDNGIAIHPIYGRQAAERRMTLAPWSTLTVRVPETHIPTLLKLAGKSLRLSDATVRVGVPEVRGLQPLPALRSRLVIIKVAHAGAADLTSAMFGAAARKQMDDLGISADAVLRVGKRRSLRLKQQEIVGYEALVEGLNHTESVTLQEHGIGGKRHMGCGVFVPVGENAK